jgi:hypothetical protein
MPSSRFGELKRRLDETLEGAPRDATHWSTRSIARERIWRAFELQPHRQDTFKLSTLRRQGISAVLTGHSSPDD